MEEGTLPLISCAFVEGRKAQLWVGQSLLIQLSKEV